MTKFRLNTASLAPWRAVIPPRPGTVEFRRTAASLHSSALTADLFDRMLQSPSCPFATGLLRSQSIADTLKQEPDSQVSLEERLGSKPLRALLHLAMQEDLTHFAKRWLGLSKTLMRQGKLQASASMLWILANEKAVPARFRGEAGERLRALQGNQVSGYQSFQEDVPAKSWNLFRLVVSPLRWGGLRRDLIRREGQTLVSATAFADLNESTPSLLNLEVAWSQSGAELPPQGHPLRLAGIRIRSIWRRWEKSRAATGSGASAAPILDVDIPTPRHHEQSSTAYLIRESRPHEGEKSLYLDTRHLPPRSGGTHDRYEDSNSNFVQEAFNFFPQPVKAALMGRINSLGNPSDEDFGRAVGDVMQQSLEFMFSKLPTVRTMQAISTKQREQVRVLDKLVDVVQRARRAGRKKILSVFDEVLGEEGLEQYEALKMQLVRLLGPHFGDNILYPHQALVSVGNGDMMALLAAGRHGFWRRLNLAIARDQEVADNINHTGLYPGKVRERITYRHDNPIIVVGPKGCQGVSPEMIKSKVLLQILNVPSKQLHHILTREYVENLPEGAHLVEAIGGWIGRPKHGEYAPSEGEQPTLLPFEMIELALKKYSRQSVSVTSIGGFAPGSQIWRKTLTRLVFAGKEGKIPYSAPSAEFVAEVFAGKGRGGNAYFKASTTHHQPSTELGKAMKNILSLTAGLLAVREMRKSLFQDGVSTNERSKDEELDGISQAKIMRPLERILRNTQLREGIRESRLGFSLEVEEDFRSCCVVKLPAILELLEEAKEAPIHDLPQLNRWIHERIVLRRSELADTRNPVMGIIGGLIEMWQEMGAVFPKGSIQVELTKEGVDSLAPFLLRQPAQNVSAHLREIDPLILALPKLFEAIFQENGDH